MSSCVIKNAKLILPDKIEAGSILIQDGRITGIFTETSAPEGEVCIDAQGHYVSAGFIDLHTHGGGGFDYMDGTVEAFQKASRIHLEHGTTSLYPTTTTSSTEELMNVFEAFRRIRATNWKGPNLLGLHLEGPYLSPEQGGAQDLRYMRVPERTEYLRILDASADIRRMTVAPELPGALELGEELCRRGILASIGHTDAMYEDVVAACEHGYTLLTHYYSGMSSLRRIHAYRHLGVIESGYLLDDLTVEIIADGKHLPKELLQLIVKCKPWNQICLITDSSRGAGLPDGMKIKLGSLKDGVNAVVEEGVAFLPNREAFAGSVCTADRCVHTMVQLAGIPLLDAVRMMTENPARCMGIANRKGSIRLGLDADLCFFDEEIHVEGVMVGGKLLVENA